MPNTLQDLQARLDVVAGQLDAGVRALVAKVTDEIGKELVSTTPVDTGYARANWRPSLNARTESPRSFLDPTGANTISLIRIVGQRFKPGDTIYIVNRVPYIGQLIAGSSPQAPPDFHQIAVVQGFARAVALVRQTGLISGAGRRRG